MYNSPTHRFSTLQKLIEHMRGIHHIPVETCTRKFQNLQHFESWKEEEEFFTKAQYVKKCAPQTCGNATISYFYCNRAGIYRPRGQCFRQIKSQGTAKVGEQCSAHIKAIVSIEAGTVDVEYCSTHHNHTVKISHLRIPNKVRNNIAAKLLQGVSMERILDDIRDGTQLEINRQHLINKQDLHNIKTQYNIEGIVRHKNDLISVTTWVEDMKAQEYNSILIFKPQGKEQLQDMNNISPNDFLLCVQTEFQRDMLKQFGSSAVCMDTTHGTNMYDFSLTTVVVVDEYGEGVPVAWMVSNREDVHVLTEFLKAIKQRTGNISPQWFMTDDAQQYYTAWIAIFGSNSTNKLLCAWHIDRAWRKALQNNIKEKDRQIEVYHQLRVLLMEIEESKFRLMLQEFLSYTQKYYHAFYTYFSKNYSNRVQQWASCYRAHAIVNTNMFLEAFHRVLKVVYLTKKHNRRIDFLLMTLLKISRDKAFERLHKLETGKTTHRLCEIHKRHKSSMNIYEQNSYTISTCTENKKWSIKSQSTQGSEYIVEKQCDSCDCQLFCKFCSICPHMYSCTCLDAVLRNTVCKHVHLLYMYADLKTSSTQLTTTHPATKDNSHIYAYLSKVIGGPRQTEKSDLLALKDTLHSMTHEIHTLVSQTTNCVALKTAKTHLQAAISTIRALRDLTNEETIPEKSTAEHKSCKAASIFFY